MTAPRVTIVVCTHDRPADLAVCLRSLVTDRSRIPREVVVVDNGSIDARPVVDAVSAAGTLPIRLLREPTPGLSRARNCAVAAARGSLLFFTDDDVAVADGWADSLAAAFDDPTIAGAMGRILPHWPHPPPAWMNGPHAVTLTLPDRGPVPHKITEHGEILIGANMAMRADALTRLERPFDTRLGHRGRQKGGYGEWTVTQHLRTSGQIAYQPEALVYHRIGSERIDWLSMRAAWFSGGFALGRCHRADGVPLPILPRRCVRAYRTYRGALSLRYRNRKSEPTAEAAYEEFYAYMWAGRHLELVLGRFPRLCDWASANLARGGAPQGTRHAVA